MFENFRIVEFLLQDNKADHFGENFILIVLLRKVFHLERDVSKVNMSVRWRVTTATTLSL